MKKYGGVYSDLDILFFTKKTFLPGNMVAAQHDDQNHGHYLNGNFLKFKKGHLFVDRAIKKFVSSYKPNHDWGAPGPGLITATMNECKRYWGNDCSDIVVSNADTFQMIRPGTIRNTLAQSITDPEASLLFKKLLTDSNGLHFSNSEIGWQPFKKFSLFHVLLSHVCPKVSEKFSDQLFE
jgi:hypothetical protein